MLIRENILRFIVCHSALTEPLIQQDQEDVPVKE